MDGRVTNQRTIRASAILSGRIWQTHTKNMRIVTMGSMFEDEWDRIYVPMIGLKYTHMRCNLGSSIRAEYFGELNV
jgi:hypothetical protein